MEIMLRKCYLAKEQHDLHNKAGRVVSKQAQLQLHFHWYNVTVKWAIKQPPGPREPLSGLLLTRRNSTLF